MPQSLTVGQVVQLKSGGPQMTVTSIGDNYGVRTVYCAWFDGSTKKQDHFPPDALEVIS